MRRRLFVVIILLGVAIIAAVLIKKLQFAKMAQQFANVPPTMVSTTQAKKATWQPAIQTVGTISAREGVDIASQVSGLIQAIHFQSGSMVKRGELLLELNDDVEQAELKNNLADLKLAELNYKRQEKLIQQSATTRSALDAAKAKQQKALAAVEKTKALIKQKNIMAPFNGKIGIRRVNVGQYVSAGTELVTLQSLHPLLINFTLPEHNLQQLHVQQTVEVSVESYPKKVFTARLIAINAKSDLQTHTIAVRALLPNPERALYPGLFASIRLLLPTQKTGIVIPKTAIAYSLYGDSVFVITPGQDKKRIAKRRYITLGETVGNNIEVLSGLKSGEQVVTTGQLKLQSNMPVSINNKITL